MNAVEFLEKIKEIIPSFCFDGNFEFRNDQKNYKRNNTYPDICYQL